jgi:hypothetical protein
MFRFYAERGRSDYDIKPPNLTYLMENGAERV